MRIKPNGKLVFPQYTKTYSKFSKSFKENPTFCLYPVLFVKLIFCSDFQFTGTVRTAAVLVVGSPGSVP